MTQAWNGHKMVHTLDDHFLTPCVLINGRIFYVNELVRRSGGWFIPLRWIYFGPGKELRAIGHVVTESLVSMGDYFFLAFFLYQTYTEWFSCSIKPTSCCPGKNIS
jgi:hypothetical protein